MRITPGFGSMNSRADMENFLDKFLWIDYYLTKRLVSTDFGFPISLRWRFRANEKGFVLGMNSRD
jgi:hypothetical protein